MAGPVTLNSKVLKLYCSIVDYTASDTDSEVWYGGHTDINWALTEFDEDDITNLIADIKNWNPRSLTNFSAALTSLNDERGDPSIKSYIYGHIFLILENEWIYSILDDFDYLLNADDRIVSILPIIGQKLDQLDFMGYDETALTIYQQLINKYEKGNNIHLLPFDSNHE